MWKEDIEIKQSINRAHISTTSDKSTTGLPFPPVHMCVVEKAVRNQTTERKFTCWREEGRVVILSPVKEICSLLVTANVRGQECYVTLHPIWLPACGQLLLSSTVNS